jgi:signal transduction histidine kinase
LTLAERILGERPARRAFEDYARQHERPWQPEQLADRALVQFTERQLAAAIGTASARLTLTSALRGSGMELGEVVSLLDEASQELRFNRQVLSTTLENISQGVSVVDADQRLIAWNRRYQEMLNYPEGMLYVGRPIADLIRYNAERGELGGGENDRTGIDRIMPDPITMEDRVRRRLDHLRAGKPYAFERVRSNGQVFDIRGQPLPGGGYVTSFSDITDYKRAERALRDINETLEQRVELRTREAEAAQQSKTRFLAAVSHDVLQPLNAARLFATALRETRDDDARTHLAERVDSALRAAEDLLDGLLDVLRLDAGALSPEWTAIDAAALLHELAAQYAPNAEGRGLRLRVCARECFAVRSDRRLLRRALQNFIANALRYTREGGVLLALRSRGAMLEFQVWDSGPGIPPHHLQQIFEEFRRFDTPQDKAGIGSERGLDLGLSICQRIARTLDHPLSMRSRIGHGSVFAIRVARTDTVPVPIVQDACLSGDSLAGLRVLCVDNDADILDGMRALLERWQAVAVLAANANDALAACTDNTPDVVLVDYQLHDHLDGLGVIAELRRRLQRDLPAALLTGDGRDAVKHAAREHGGIVLTKPVKPASLRAFLGAVG